MENPNASQRVSIGKARAGLRCPEMGRRFLTTSRRNAAFQSEDVHAFHKPAAAADKFDSRDARTYKDGDSCEVGG